MTKIPKYKIIDSKDKVILFFPHSMDIISMTPGDFAEATEDQLQECYENFLDRFNKKRQEKYPTSTSPGKHGIAKLMIDLTDDCSLDCTYCYASKYYHKRHMSEETIDKIIDKFFLSQAVSRVMQIVFFGGEPLLNFAGMRYFVKRVKNLYEENKTPGPTGFNIITNGTVYTKEIADFFKEHNVGVLVSCDGPAELQDAQRPFRDSGKGSYRVVGENIRRMVEDGQRVRVECTVTQHTMELGYNHKKLKEFFSRELGIDKVAFVPEMITGFGQSYQFSRHFHEPGNSYIRALFDLDFQDDIFDTPYRLLMKSPLLLACGLGKTIFHILANGDIYPCQLVAGMEDYKLTHIDSFDDSYFKNNNWIERYEEHSAKCNSCWAKTLCKFCPARMIIENGTYTLPDKACEEKRTALEELIARVVELRQDKNQWDDFVKRLSETPASYKQKIEEADQAGKATV